MEVKEILLKIKAETQRGQKGNPYSALRNIYELTKMCEKILDPDSQSNT